MRVARDLVVAALPVLAAIRVADAAPAAVQVHVVQRGDTLAGIARRHGVTVATLVRANGLPAESARLKVGRRLTIPASVARAKGTGQPLRARRVATTGALVVPASLVLSVPDFAVSCPSFLWPIDGWVSSSFGRRRRGWHRGVDIMAPPGTTIIAAAGGLVVASGWEGRYGRVVKIAHEHGFVSVYAHNTDNLVELGQWVLAGEPIATVGRTGRATAEHVHFEIRRDGLRYNPLYLLPLPPRITTEEVELDEDEEPS